MCKALGRLGAAMSAIGAVLLLGAAPAAAHAAFESSDPPAGAVIGDEVDTITLRFTGSVDPTGLEFEVLDSAGRVSVPVESQALDEGATWVLRFTPALTGPVALRWEVQAPDAHPISGGFTFEAGQTPAGAAEPASGRTVTAPVVEQPTAATTAVPQTPAFDAFLAGEAEPQLAALSADVGRTVSVVAALVAVGALVFAVAVLRGEQSDFGMVMHWLRRAAVLLVAASLLDAVALVVRDAGGVPGVSDAASALGGMAGLAVGVRILGGLMLVAAARVPLSHAVDTADPVVRIRELVGASIEFAGLGDRPAVDPAPYSRDGDIAWATPFTPAHPVAGAGLVVLSFAFDGHTVSEGAWLAMALLDVLHVFGGAVWVGGVLMLAAVLWHRRRQRRQSRAGQLALRFSVVASGAVVLVGAAGAAMAAMILDHPGQLFSTPWGRLLSAKSVLVLLAASIGGYNHHVLIPTMVDPGRGRDERFRRAVTVEAILLTIVGAVTAFLVVAAS